MQYYFFDTMGPWHTFVIYDRIIGKKERKKKEKTQYNGHTESWTWKVFNRLERRSPRLIIPFVWSLDSVVHTLQQNQSTNTNTNSNSQTHTEREMGVVVGGVILDSSVVLANSPPQHENPSLQPALDSLLRKLRHSKIPTVMIFSLSFLQLHCSFCNILLLPFWVFFD